MITRKLVGILGSGQIGYDPFDRRTWSGLSFYVFSELKRHGALQRAFGVELPRFRRALEMLRHIHPQREVWKQQFYMSRSYRNGLTRVIERNLRSDDFEHDFFVLGAMYDVPSLVAGRARVFSYHDGNLAQALKSPYMPSGISHRRIDEGLAFERDVYRRTNRIFVMSEYSRRSFIEDYDVSAARVTNVGAGVNLDQLPPPISDRNYDSQSILFIGVDFARKGGAQLLQAFQRVRSVHSRATLHIVGPRKLQVLSADGVTCHGFLDKTNPADKARLDALFADCSLFVLPSLYEPFGVAPLEAMLHEIPAIVSRGWALEETVTPGVTGEHAEPGSVEELADKMIALLGSPDKLQRMGRAARETVLARFTWPQVVDRLVSEIDEVQRTSRSPIEAPASAGLQRAI